MSGENNKKFEKAVLHIFWAASGGAFTSLCMIQVDFKELVLCSLISMFICAIFVPRIGDILIKKLVQMKLYSILFYALSSIIIAYYNIVMCYYSHNIYYYLMNKAGMASNYIMLFQFVSTLALPMFFVFVLYGFEIIKYGFSILVRNYKRQFFIAGIISVIVILVYFFINDIFFTGYDSVYSMDSSYYIKTNVYIHFTNPENDIRQPFFGVASSLIFALPSLISAFIPVVYPYLIGISNVFLIITGIILLIDMMKLNSNRELAFAFFTVLYPTVIFFLVIEQYAVAFFFTMTFLHQLYFGKKNEFVYALNTGTLAISGAWLPVIGIEQRTKKFDFKKICYCVLAVIGTAIVFGKFSLFIHSIDSIKRLLRFSGVKTGLPITQNFKQYFNFVTNCFIKTGTTIKNMNGVEGYALSGEGYYWILGILIFLLCIVSFMMNRTKYICKISIYWIIIGFIVMAIAGWGTVENNLVLYSLYFGWPFAVFIFELIQKMLHIFVVKVCAIAGIFCIGLYNIWTLLSIFTLKI